MQIDQRVDAAQRRSSFDGSIQLAKVLLIRQLCAFLAESRFCRLDHLVQIFSSHELAQQITERDKAGQYFVLHDALDRPGSLSADLGNLLLQLLATVLQIIK